MSKKKKSRLGKGLGALLGDVRQTTEVAQQPVASSAPETPSSEPRATQDSSASSGPVSGLRELPIELLQRGDYQPRIQMDKEALEELAESIRAQGIIQPLLVRQIGSEKYEIIAGERRWRGA